jgi:hypothetical protein
VLRTRYCCTYPLSHGNSLNRNTTFHGALPIKLISHVRKLVSIVRCGLGITVRACVRVCVCVCDVYTFQ